MSGRGSPLARLDGARGSGGGVSGLTPRHATILTLVNRGIAMSDDTVSVSTIATVSIAIVSRTREVSVILAQGSGAVDRKHTVTVATSVIVARGRGRYGRNRGDGEVERNRRGMLFGTEMTSGLSREGMTRLISPSSTSRVILRSTTTAIWAGI